MAWGRKKRRIADLEAHVRVLITDLKQARDDSDTHGWNARTAQAIADALIARTRERDDAKRRLRATEDQLGAARRENALRSRKQVEYSNRAVAAVRRLARALRACARYRAEIATQDAVIRQLAHTAPRPAEVSP